MPTTAKRGRQETSPILTDEGSIEKLAPRPYPSVFRARDINAAIGTSANCVTKKRNCVFFTDPETTSSEYFSSGEGMDDKATRIEGVDPRITRRGDKPGLKAIDGLGLDTRIKGKTAINIRESNTMMEDLMVLTNVTMESRGV